MEVPHHPAGLSAEEIREMVGDSPLMLEIGCNDGEDTQKFLDAMPGIKLYCFEPDPRPAARWIRRITDKRAHLYTVAVGAVTGLATFHLSGGDFPSDCNPEHDWDMSSSIHQPTGHLDRDKLVTFGRTIFVQEMTLDEWCWKVLGRFGPYPRFDFLWADVQGAEGDLIRGGRITLLEHVRYFYTEYYDTPQYEGQPDLSKICALLPRQFELIGLYAGNALFKHRWSCY
jgi:FkbM family methyltransferase